MVMVLGSALTGAVVTIVLVLGLPVPASAGGATWRFDRAAYQPGDLATGVTAIGWEHNPDLGTPAEGPYLGYLVRAEPQGEATAAAWPNIPRGATEVARVEVYEGPVEEAPGFWVGPHHARLRFTVPALPAGTYDVLHCNNPCTKPLADIIGGRIVIGSAPDAPASASTTQPTPSTPVAGEGSTADAPAVRPRSDTTATATAEAQWLPSATIAAGAISLMAVVRLFRTRRTAS